MKATEQYGPVVLFIMLHNVTLTFESDAKILECVPIQMKAVEPYSWVAQLVLSFQYFSKAVKCWISLPFPPQVLLKAKGL